MRANKVAGRVCLLFVLLPAFFSAAGCKTAADFSAPLSGRYVTASVGIKNYEIIGPVYAESTEIHTIGFFGIVRKVEGSKITYYDLMQQAAFLQADDIIDVRIDMSVTGKRVRVFTYTGKAVAVKYVDNTRAAPENEIPEGADFLNR